MKKNIKWIALAAVLSAAASSCQKENEADSHVSAPEMSAVMDMTYSVDGEYSYLSFSTDTFWLEFLEQMFALAEEGHRVTFYSGTDLRNVSTKEKVTYSTTDKAKAIIWAYNMINEGYEVTVIYDETTGVYNCTAIK